VDDPFAEALRTAREISERSPTAVAATKKLFQATWMASEEKCLELETDIQRTLVPSWNQFVASVRNFDWKLPYKT